MPGKILSLTPTQAVGWAKHERLPDYRVLVNVVHRSVIVRSVLAEAELSWVEAPDAPPRSGFRFDLTRLGVAEDEIPKLRFSIGETDEWIDMPEGWTGTGPGPLTVEDLLVGAHSRRAWVTGMTYVDAASAGLRAETIIDMLYRDYLGRPSDPNGLAHYASAVLAGANTYDDIRRSFVDADEFHMRRKHVDNAPGSIFSQKIVMAVASADAGQSTPATSSGMTVVATELARLDGAEFVTELYRRLLLKEPDEGGLAHYIHQLHSGVPKMAVIRTIAGELEAITAGVRVVGYPPEPQAEPAQDETRAEADAVL